MLKTAVKTAKATPKAALPVEPIITSESLDQHSGSVGEQQAAPEDRHCLHRLDQAQNLTELDADESAEPANAERTAIESFKDHDRRTMRIVELDGELYKQVI